MKRIVSIMLMLAVALMLTPCVWAEAAGTKDLRLGSSDFVITVDEGFEYSAITEDELADGQVGYYYSDKTAMDFDVYQFKKEPADISLAQYTQEEAALYEGTSEIATEDEINAIPVAWYRTMEEYDGEIYDTVTYIVEYGDEFVEIVFWLDGDDAEAEMDAIIETLRHAEGAELDGAEIMELPQVAPEGAEDGVEYGIVEDDPDAEEGDPVRDLLAGIVREIAEDAEVDATDEYIDQVIDNLDEDKINGIRDAVGTAELQLGTSPFSISIPADYEEGDMTEEDIADGQVGYYHGAEDQMDFDVYQFSKEGVSDNLAHYVLEEASLYEGTTEVVANDMFNDIPVAWYRTVEEYEGEAYPTLTYIMENGDEYVEIVFWLEDDSDEAAVLEIMETLREE